jgi:hypothetical protein
MDLSDGRGIRRDPGPAQVVLQVSGKKTEHTINVRPRGLYHHPTVVIPTGPDSSESRRGNRR